jgi:thymidylate kinase
MRRRRGLSIALLGPDGAGKSTLAAALQAESALPVEVVKVGLGAARPLGSLALRWAFGTVRVARVALAARLALARGRIVVWDRHPLEDAATGAVGRRVLGPGRSWMAWLFPAPHLIVVLDAHPDELRARRSAEDPAQLASLRSIYLALAAEERVRTVVVDATRPVAELRAVVHAALTSLREDQRD